MALITSELIGFMALMAFFAVQVAQVICVNVRGLHVFGFFSQCGIVPMTALAFRCFNDL